MKNTVEYEDSGIISAKIGFIQRERNKLLPLKVFTCSSIKFMENCLETTKRKEIEEEKAIIEAREMSDL